MRAFIAGSTGVLGRRLVADLTEAGHEVVGLVRDDTGAEAVESRGGEPHRGDLLDPDSLRGGVDGTDVAIHAATAIPTSDKPAAEEWERNDRVRRDGARNLVEAAADAGVDRYVQTSIVWVARPPDGPRFDEESPPHPDRTTQSALDAERLVESAAEERGFDATILRYGFFYGPDAAHSRKFARDLLAGDLPVVGRGLLGRADAPLSYVHADDASAATVAALEAGIDGTYHVVDDEPAPFAALLESLADRLDAPEPSRVPGWLAKFFVGRDTVRTLTRPMRTTNDRLREATDWEPDYPTYRDGLDHLVSAWEADGTIVETDEGYEWNGEV